MNNSNITTTFLITFVLLFSRETRKGFPRCKERGKGGSKWVRSAC